MTEISIFFSLKIDYFQYIQLWTMEENTWELKNWCESLNEISRVPSSTTWRVPSSTTWRVPSSTTWRVPSSTTFKYYLQVLPSSTAFKYCLESPFTYYLESPFKYYLESPFMYYLESPFKYYLESARIVCFSSPFLQNRSWSLSIVSGLYLK